jgi:hypothetical protein
MGFLRRTSGKRGDSGAAAEELGNPSPPDDDDRPVLAVDVDGVISLFGFEGQPPMEAGRFHLIDGMPHLISHAAGGCLRRLMPDFHLIWATGWEEKANDYLPNLLGLPELPTLHFGPDARFGTAHWKLGPIGAYAAGRPLAWIDDSLNDACREWAAERAEPTLLVETESMHGIGDEHVETLLRWAESVPGYTHP